MKYFNKTACLTVYDVAVFIFIAAIFGERIYDNYTIPIIGILVYQVMSLLVAILAGLLIPPITNENDERRYEKYGRRK
jgi:uncharacterized membrane protein YcaP (DUF421 family)